MAHPIIELQNHHIFDLDGTILDSFPVVADIFATVVAPYGVPADEAKTTLYANTHARLKEMIPTFFRDRGTPLASEITTEIYADFERRFAVSDAEFFPGAIDTLHRLKDRGKTLFLSSLSSDALVERRLVYGGIEKDLFAMSLGRTRLLKGPLHIEAFAMHLGMDVPSFARYAVLWGDTAFDMQIAQDHGIMAVGVVGTLTSKQLGDAGAAFTIPSLESLLPSLRR